MEHIKHFTDNLKGAPSFLKFFQTHCKQIQKRHNYFLKKLYFTRSVKKQENPLKNKPLNHITLPHRASCIYFYPDSIITFVLCTATRKPKESNILAASN